MPAQGHSVDPEQVGVFPRRVWNTSLGWSFLPLPCTLHPWQPAPRPPPCSSHPVQLLQMVLLARRIIGGGTRAPRPTSSAWVSPSHLPTSPGTPDHQRERPLGG